MFLSSISSNTTIPSDHNSLSAPLKQKLIDSRIFLQILEISNTEIETALLLEFNLFVSMTVRLLLPAKLHWVLKL